MADATILRGYEKLAQAQAKQADVAGAFFGALDLKGRKAKKEKEIEEIQQKVNSRMEGLKGDINLSAVEDPKLRNAICNFAVAGKNTYSDAANRVAPLTNTSSPEYQYETSLMNGVNDSFVSTRSEMDYITKLQESYKETMAAGGFSLGNKDTDEFNAMAQIFGGGGDYTVVADNGHITYTVDGKEYKAADLKLPNKPAFAEAEALLQTNADFFKLGRELNVNDAQLLSSQYKNLLKTEDAVRSIISDGDFGNVIATEDIDVDEIGWEEARDVFVERMIKANSDSARMGIGKNKPNSKKSTTGTQLTYPQQLKAAEKKEVISQIQSGYDKPIATGRRLKNGQELFLTLNAKVGKWVLTDAAGTAVAGAGGNMVTFDTEEKATAYIK